MVGMSKLRGQGPPRGRGRGKRPSIVRIEIEFDTTK